MLVGRMIGRAVTVSGSAVSGSHLIELAFALLLLQ
jgi:hypothetical protein